MGRGLAWLAMLTAVSLVAAAPAYSASTREEYAQQADPICASADHDTTVLWKRFIRLNNKFKIHAAANALEAIGHRNISNDNQLRPITPPPGDEAAISGWIGLWDQIGQKWIRAGSKYRQGKYRQAGRLINSTGPLGDQADALISDFPFKHCGGGP